MSNQKNLMFVFDRMPDQNGCNFIECEDEAGRSICAGEWRDRPDGLVELVVPVSYYAQSELAALREELARYQEGNTKLVDRVEAAEQRYSKLFDENDELFESAVGLLASLQQGLYTGHDEKELQGVIDKITGKINPLNREQANEQGN